MLVAASRKHLANLDAGARVGATDIRSATDDSLVSIVTVVSVMTVAVPHTCWSVMSVGRTSPRLRTPNSARSMRLHDPNR